MTGGSGSPLIRDSTAADVAAIQAIYGHHVAHGVASFELDEPDMTAMIRRRDAVLEAGLPHLVAEIGGAVLGFTCAGPYRGRPAYRHTLETTVYVDPETVGRGVGRALLGALVERCAGLGYRQMVAVVGDSANAPSIRLHEAPGFERVGLLRSVGFKHGRWLDSVVMQRDLGDGDRTPPEDD
jgi:phosphinothricin acetyltransferase